MGPLMVIKLIKNNRNISRSIRPRVGMSESNSGISVPPARKKRKAQYISTTPNGINAVYVSQTQIDPRVAPELAVNRAHKWRVQVGTSSGLTTKTVGSKKAAETLRRKFFAQYLDSTTQISKKDAQS